MYTHSTMQDYPSISQVNLKVKQNSINVIFAVTAEQFGVYEQLGQNIEGASSGTLSEDSSNVVDLVKEQYDVSTRMMIDLEYCFSLPAYTLTTCKKIFF